MKIVAFYFALFSFVYLGLTARVIMARYAEKKALGSSQGSPLSRYIRAHANFAEYTPFFMILFLFVSMSGLSATFLHVIGSLFLIARISHAWGLMVEEKYDEAGNYQSGTFLFRQFGMITSLSLIFILAAICFTLIF